MRISLLAIGTRMPAWVEEAVAEYRKRLPPELTLDLRELPMAKRGKNPDVPRLIEKEADTLLAAIPDGDQVIALDVQGRTLSTEALSGKLDGWLMEGRNVSFLVGGPDGLSPRCLQRADQRWSLSELTLPHPLVRVLMAEQIYRAWTILTNHPYHR